MKLAYQAYDKSGRLIRDTIEADDATLASAELRRQGLYVTQIGDGVEASPDSTPAVPSGATAAHRVLSHVRRLLGGGRRLKNLSMFTRQLHVLCSTGTPLVEALGALQRQARDTAWRETVADVRQRVEEGAPLSEAMAGHPTTFSPIFRSLVAAGESGGNFGDMLERIGKLVSRQVQVRTHLSGALVYPSLLLVVAGVVLVLMLSFVLPRFTGLFDTLGAELPPSTQMLIAVSEALRSYWWVVLLALGALGVAGHWWLRTPAGVHARDTALLRVPGLGAITRSFITARLCRLIGTLLVAQVPMLEALRLTREAAGNVYYRKLIDRAEDAVTSGEPISTAFADEQLISPMVCEAIRSGEATGQIGPLLLNIADYLDENNEVVVKSLSSILEPLILIGLGVLVGLVALAMFLPLFDLTASATR